MTVPAHKDSTGKSLAFMLVIKSVDMPGVPYGESPGAGYVVRKQDSAHRNTGRALETEPVPDLVNDSVDTMPNLVTVCGHRGLADPGCK